MINIADFGLLPSNSRKHHVGQRFGRWAILALGRRHDRPKALAVAQCDCGTAPKVVQVQNLSSGRSKDCGCGRRSDMVKHGHSRDPLYRAWHNMHSRCANPADPNFPNYGGRGISVCQRWQSVDRFIADMSDGFRPGLSIERNDNSRGYSPENCRWATAAEQTRNRRTSRTVEFNGRLLSLKEWADETGISYSALAKRHQRGWPADRMLTTPPLDAAERMRLASAARKRPMRR